MIMVKKTVVTAAELAAKLNSSAEMIARRQLDDKQRAEQRMRLIIEEGPLLEDLREVGWNVNSVWDFVNISTPYPEVIPVLLKHLTLPYSDRVKEGIARALAVPEEAVREAWPVLIEEFQKYSMDNGVDVSGNSKKLQLGAKVGLACALAIAVTDLISLVADERYGESRVILLNALKKRRKKDVAVKLALDDFLKDPALKNEIKSWKG